MYKKIKRIHVKNISLVLSCLTLFIGSFSIPFVSVQSVIAQSASELRDQSNQLQNQIDANQETAQVLGEQVVSLQQKISQLDSEIKSTQDKIAETERKIAGLKDDLIKTETELERQRGILKSNLKELYKTTGATSTELLFASDNFSSFINKQEYLDQLKNSVKTSLEGIIVLKKELETKKAEAEQLQASLERQKQEQENARTERATLLEQTQGEEAKYRAIVDDLQAQQKEINRRIAALATSISYGGTGSYPWANEGYPCSGFDPWGMCFRQCVSYTAWKVANSGRYMPPFGHSMRGNATDWVDAARDEGIPVDQNPQIGDVAILQEGYYGHAMYVEDVYSNGTIRVSQYNFGGPGYYSEMTISSNRSTLYFIHFPY